MLYHTGHASSKNWYFCPSIHIYTQRIFYTNVVQHDIPRHSCQAYTRLYNFKKFYISFNVFLNFLKSSTNLLKIFFSYSNFIIIIIAFKFFKNLLKFYSISSPKFWCPLTFSQIIPTFSQNPNFLWKYESTPVCQNEKITTKKLFLLRYGPQTLHFWNPSCAYAPTFFTHPLFSFPKSDESNFISEICFFFSKKGQFSYKFSTYRQRRLLFKSKIAFHVFTALEIRNEKRFKLEILIRFGCGARADLIVENANLGRIRLHLAPPPLGLIFVTRRCAGFR